MPESVAARHSGRARGAAQRASCDRPPVGQDVTGAERAVPGADDLTALRPPANLQPLAEITLTALRALDDPPVRPRDVAADKRRVHLTRDVPGGGREVVESGCRRGDDAEHRDGEREPQHERTVNRSPDGSSAPTVSEVADASMREAGWRWEIRLVLDEPLIAVLRIATATFWYRPRRSAGSRSMSTQRGRPWPEPGFPRTPGKRRRPPPCSFHLRCSGAATDSARVTASTRTTRRRPGPWRVPLRPSRTRRSSRR